MKKILVIGNGGREHTIIQALSRSPQDVEIFNFATGINPGIKTIIGEDHIIVDDIMDLEVTKNIAQDIRPDWALVGPDDPIGNGSVDALLELGIKSFAPQRVCAQLETSKAFTRHLCDKYDIPGAPGFFVSSTAEDPSRKEFFDQYNGQIVVKADGLLGGKGVLVADEHFETFKEADEFAIKSIEKFGRVVFEEKLIGEEFSFISLVDGETVLDCPAIQDHKRAFEGDTGPNTGGMGCISDEHGSLPFLNTQNLQEAHNITVQVMKAVEQETGQKYVGVMYGGFMVTKDGVKLIEYNARFGDPEALNILPIMESDFVEVCEAAINHRLSTIGSLQFKKVATVVKYLCPEGYPTNPVKNVPIHIIKPESKIENCYFASVAEEDGALILKGSRAIGITGMGANVEEALEHCEAMIGNFTGPLFYRKDIGTAALIQKRIGRMAKITN